MNPEQQEALIKTYLSDKNKLYQDWYLEISQPKLDKHVERYSTPPKSPLEELVQRFKNYFLEKQEYFKQKVCVEWEYSRKKEAYKNRSLLIAALSDFLVTVGISTISVLVSEGYLDSLCENNSNG